MHMSTKCLWSQSHTHGESLKIFLPFGNSTLPQLAFIGNNLSTIRNCQLSIKTGVDYNRAAISTHNRQVCFAGTKLWTESHDC